MDHCFADIGQIRPTIGSKYRQSVGRCWPNLGRDRPALHNFRPRWADAGRARPELVLLPNLTNHIIVFGRIWPRLWMGFTRVHSRPRPIRVVTHVSYRIWLNRRYSGGAHLSRRWRAPLQSCSFGKAAVMRAMASRRLQRRGQGRRRRNAHKDLQSWRRRRGQHGDVQTKVLQTRRQGHRVRASGMSSGGPLSAARHLGPPLTAQTSGAASNFGAKIWPSSAEVS